MDEQLHSACAAYYRDILYLLIWEFTVRPVNLSKNIPRIDKEYLVIRFVFIKKPECCRRCNRSAFQILH